MHRAFGRVRAKETHHLLWRQKLTRHIPNGPICMAEQETHSIIQTSSWHVESITPETSKCTYFPQMRCNSVELIIIQL